MRILFKEPGKEPRTMIIPNTLKMLQDLVGGYIETVRVSADAIRICNEDGKNLGLEPNFFFGAIGDVIVGPVIIAGDGGEDFTDLPEDEAEEISRILRGGFEV